MAGPDFPIVKVRDNRGADVLGDWSWSGVAGTVLIAVESLAESPDTAAAFPRQLPVIQCGFGGLVLTALFAVIGFGLTSRSPVVSLVASAASALFDRAAFFLGIYLNDRAHTWG